MDETKVVDIEDSLEGLDEEASVLRAMYDIHGQNIDAVLMRQK